MEINLEINQISSSAAKQDKKKSSAGIGLNFKCSGHMLVSRSKAAAAKACLSDE